MASCGPPVTGASRADDVHESQQWLAGNHLDERDDTYEAHHFRLLADRSSTGADRLAARAAIGMSLAAELCGDSITYRLKAIEDQGMRFVLRITILCIFSWPAWAESALVLQSDFGVKDGAVAAMKGVAVGISATVPLHDLTHEIPAFNIWEAALRLEQTAEYWPTGTVFVSVVDPGVGSERKSVVMRTRSGHYFVTPDNGTLTFVAARLGISAVREIDEAVNRRSNSEKSYTFHGRDVYAYTGARLAAGLISFEQVGRELPPLVVAIDHQQARFDNGAVDGTISILDVQYGNVWTNIDRQTFERLQLAAGDSVAVTIRHGAKIVTRLEAPYLSTFSAAAARQPLLYLNSLDRVALALNQASFAERYHVQSGPSWSIHLSRK